ncbi:MAG: hypothetical protein R2683_03920 [Bifidobacterium adolescentis]
MFEWNKTETRLTYTSLKSPPKCCTRSTRRPGKPLVDLIVDHAGMKGTGTWTVQTALSLAVPVTGIAEAVFARGLSSEADLRESPEAGLLWPDGKLNLNDDEKKAFIEDIRQALASRSSPHRASTRSPPPPRNTAGTSTSPPWHASGVAAASSARSSSTAFPEAFESGEANVSLLFAVLQERHRKRREVWRNVVAQAAINGLPTPAFASSLSYFDGLRSKRLPAASSRASATTSAPTYARGPAGRVPHPVGRAGPRIEA